MQKWAVKTTKYHCGRIQFSRGYDILSDLYKTRMLIMFDQYYIHASVEHTQHEPAKEWPSMLEHLNYKVDSILYKFTYPAVC